MYVLASSVGADDDELSLDRATPTPNTTIDVDQTAAVDELDEDDRRLWSSLTQWLSHHDNESISSHTLSDGTVAAPESMKEADVNVDTDGVHRTGRDESLLTPSLLSLVSLQHLQQDSSSARRSVALRELPHNIKMLSSSPVAGGSLDHFVLDDETSATLTPGSKGRISDDDETWEDWMKDSSPATQDEVRSIIAERSQSCDTLVGGPFLTIATKPTKRKLSFGALLGNEDRRRMPPPRPTTSVRRDSSGTFELYIERDACETSDKKDGFQDISMSPGGFGTASTQPPSTPRFLDAAPPSPFLVRADDQRHTYPRCHVLVPDIISKAAGEQTPVFTDLSESYLDGIRKRVDPNFENEEFWGDDFYFRQDSIPFKYQEDRGLHPYQRSDWSKIWRGLQFQADRIPMPNERTLPAYTPDQASRLFGGPSVPNQPDPEIAAYLERRWVQSVSNKSGSLWVRERLGKQVPPPFRRETDPNLDDFCKSATFIAGRTVSKPDLSHTENVLRYASQPIGGYPTQFRPGFSGSGVSKREMQVVTTNHQLSPSNTVAPTETLSKVSPFNRSMPSLALQNAPHPGQYLIPTDLAQQLSLQQPPQVYSNALPQMYQQPPQMRSTQPRSFTPFGLLGPRELSTVRDKYMSERARHYLENNIPGSRTVTEPTVSQLRTFYQNFIPEQTQAQTELAEELQGRPLGRQERTLITPRSETRPMSLNQIANQNTAFNDLGSPFISPKKMHRDMDF